MYKYLFICPHCPSLSLIVPPLLALPCQGPVASVFWLDDALESALRLDSIVTLVDAKNFTRQLHRVPEDGGGGGGGGGDGSPAREQEQEHEHEQEQEQEQQSAERRPRNEAAMQVAYADRVLVNKVRGLCFVAFVVVSCSQIVLAAARAASI